MYGRAEGRTRIVMMMMIYPLPKGKKGKLTLRRINYPLVHDLYDTHLNIVEQYYQYLPLEVISKQRSTQRKRNWIFSISGYGYPPYYRWMWIHSRKISLK